MFTPGRSLEFAATFSGGPFQASGFGQAFLAAPWAAFDYGSAGTSMSANTSGTTTGGICPGCTNTPHVYRIDWTSTTVTYFIDGAQVASHAATIPQNMRPILADSGGRQLVTCELGALQVPYATSGNYLSRVMDGGQRGELGGHFLDSP